MAGMGSLVVLLLSGAYVGWNIGSNDAGNCIGTSVGSGLIPYRRAIVLVGLFAVLGALLQGQAVIKTVGTGIITAELPFLAIFTAMISAGLIVTLATFFKLPVSTSQAVVGGLVGVGLAVGAEIDFSVLVTIGEVWIVCPFLTGLMAFILYHLLAVLLRRVRRPLLWDRSVKALLFMSACYVSFSLGANNIGNSVGLLTNFGIQSRWIALLGGGALALGAWTYGWKVTETVGSGIVPLDPLSAACAQAAAAIAAHFFAILGLPVSISQAVVGAVVGVGLVRGMRAIKRRRIAEIGIGWVATPTIAGLFSYTIYHLLSLTLSRIGS
jgi:PiT family inorganic phosphate transporter